MAGGWAARTGVNVGARDESARVEVDAYELTLSYHGTSTSYNIEEKAVHRKVRQSYRIRIV